MADYSDFIVLLARQRSGTNALTSVLETHEDIYCFNEIFDERFIDSGNELCRGYNFFNFFSAYAKDNPSRILPNNHEILFTDYLEFLRCFSGKKYKLINIKYNSVHHIAEMWHAITAEPTLFRYIKKYRLHVFHLTRNNMLRAFISDLKALKSSRYHCFDKEQVRAVESSVEVNVTSLLARLSMWENENKIIADSLVEYERYIQFEYSGLFNYKNGEVSNDKAEQIRQYLNLECSFPTVRSCFKKIASLPLEKSITNYEEVKEGLVNTQFAHCLEDEPGYT